jgi:hypothetical protein
MAIEVSIIFEASFALAKPSNSFKGKYTGTLSSETGTTSMESN